MLHRIIGIVVGLFFAQVFTGNSDFFIGFQEAMETNIDGMGGAAKAARGSFYIYLCAIACVICLIFPEQLESRYNKWSPTGVGKEWPAGFFIFLGYCFFCLTNILFYVFE